MDKPKFIVGRKYKSPRSQVTICVGVTRTEVKLQWPSGNVYAFSHLQLSTYKEVKESLMPKFKAGDVVTCCVIPTEELVVKSCDGGRVWFTKGTWEYASQCTLVRHGNSTFIVGQKYIDSAKNVMIVLAQSPSDPERFYIEYVSEPHVSGSEFIKNAHKWSVYYEPKKIEVYINAYPTGISRGYETRKKADATAGTKRIACKRVEFIEGEFDE